MTFDHLDFIFSKISRNNHKFKFITKIFLLPEPQYQILVVEWKQTVRGDFFRYQTVTTAWFNFRFWVEW